MPAEDSPGMSEIPYDRRTRLLGSARAFDFYGCSLFDSGLALLNHGVAEKRGLVEVS
jgi:hypothetical protein